MARHIPFIFVSAHVEREQIRKGMNLGADDYLTKPFTESELADMVRTRLAIHARRRETLETQLAEMNARALRCLSHEIRTPLNGVMGGLELMQMDRPDSAPEELGIVATSAVRLERTLLRYLAFMEAASDSLPLRSQELAPVDMLIEDVASRIAESCDRGPISSCTWTARSAPSTPASSLRCWRRSSAMPSSSPIMAARCRSSPPPRTRLSPSRCATMASA